MCTYTFPNEELLPKNQQARLFGNTLMFLLSMPPTWAVVAPAVVTVLVEVLVERPGVATVATRSSTSRSENPARNNTAPSGVWESLWLVDRYALLK